jgi:hypothetical protein
MPTEAIARGKFSKIKGGQEAAFYLNQSPLFMKINAESAIGAQRVRGDVPDMS